MTYKNKPNLLLTAVLALTLSLYGCEAAKNTPAQAATSPAEQQVEQVEETPAPTVEPAETTPTEEPSASFQYIHDPRENARAMEDAIVNPDAVYGFSPNPDSKRLAPYAEYDWTDKEVVEQARQSRIEYHNSFESMNVMLREMREQNATIEEMARAISAERNRLRLAAYEGDPDGLAVAKKSNLEKYGDENGPTADSLYEKYGSWELVIQNAFNSNMGMDACCGLYDEYYSLYQELGLVPSSDN